ncbi:hypothetical protein MATL_G00005290 [Megalops atlanticus]|uniref:Palmdelphin n=1 Tax=Megalops atlanticus TaxID=7932 RepID=A0A9D3TKX2_MEGAT|nr:hypothetical protein MATL_G00005290 [Megalops atlanticus]
MDEAEKYQQRLQAIAEKRRLQEEQERARREMEDERLRLQQLKRKSLRDQWLMDGPPSTPDSVGPSSPLWGSQAREIEERIDKLQTESQQLAEEADKLQQQGDVQAQNDTDGDRADISQSDEAEKAEDVTGDDGSPEIPVLPTSLQENTVENGEQERSVVGVVEVQVERDLKTGATTIKSVSTVAPGETAPSGETVFDDGRTSVQTVGGLGDGAQPTPEELGQVLSAVAGTAAEAAPEEAAVTPNGTEGDGEEAHKGPAEENGCAGADSSPSPPQAEGAPSTNGPVSDAQSPQLEGGSAEGAPDHLGEGPVTMTFLGFTEAEPGQDGGEEDAGEIIRAERVIITDEGEELPETEQEAPPGYSTEPPAPSDNSAAAEPSEAETEAEAEAPQPDTEAGAGGPLDSETKTEPEAPQAEEAAAADTETETETQTGEAACEGAGQPVEEAPAPEEELPAASAEAEASASQLPVYSAGQPSLSPQPGPEEEGVGAEGKIEEDEAAAPRGTPGQFQDVPLDGNAKVEDAGEPELQPLKETTETPVQPSEQETLLASSKASGQTDAAAPSRGEGGDAPKRKTCQCCSVM